MRAANANAHRCAAFTPKVKAPISETLRARRAPIFVAERSDECWELLEYSNGECWLFDNASASPVRKVGMISDGHGESQVDEGVAKY